MCHFIAQASTLFSASHLAISASQFSWMKNTFFSSIVSPNRNTASCGPNPNLQFSEVGGKGKSFEQIADVENSFIAADDTKQDMGTRFLSECSDYCIDTELKLPNASPLVDCYK